MKKLTYFLIGWQIFDILIHVLSDNFEILRVSANVIVIVWAYYTLKKVTKKSLNYLVLFSNITLNFIWLAFEGFVLPLIFAVLVLTTVIIQIIIMTKKNTLDNKVQE